jgi:HK97 family phage prohead protease
MADKNVLKRLHIDINDAKIKASPTDSGSGHLIGYASAFNVIDLSGDVIRKGAFTKTAMERIPSRKVPLQSKHINDATEATDTIGTLISGIEDDYGFLIDAELSSIPEAQKVRTLVHEGHIKGLSVAIYPLQYRFIEIDGQTVTDITELKMIEVTVTAFPCNEDAVILSVKSLGANLKALQTELESSDSGARKELLRRLQSVVGQDSINDVVGLLGGIEVTKPVTQKMADHSFGVRLAKCKLILSQLKENI